MLFISASKDRVEAREEDESQCSHMINWFSRSRLSVLAFKFEYTRTCLRRSRAHCYGQIRVYSFAYSTCLPTFRRLRSIEGACFGLRFWVDFLRRLTDRVRCVSLGGGYDHQRAAVGKWRVLLARRLNRSTGVLVEYG